MTHLAVVIAAVALLGAAATGCEPRNKGRQAKVEAPAKADPPHHPRRHPSHDHGHGSHPHARHEHHHHPHPHPHLGGDSGHHHPY